VVRISRAGLIGSACFLAADAAWLAVARPPWLWQLSAWFALAIVVGAFLAGVANQVSLARAHLAAPALVASLDSTKLLQLAAVVVLAGATDLLDGIVARRLGRTTRLGGALDPVVDGIFFGAVAVGLAAGGAYPLWLAGVVVARYALPALVGTVLLAAGRRPELRHTPVGQVSTTLIAVLLGGIALLRGLGQPVGVLLAVSVVAIPVAALATFGNLFWANRQAIIRSGMRPSG
jgi:cardiolipin synthase